MLGCEGPQQSHNPGEPQVPDSGGIYSSAGWSSGLHEGRFPQGLPAGTPDQGEQQAIGHKHSQRPIQIQENALWSQNVTECLPDENGPHHGKERCPKVISIHDNIVVYGTSEEDHDSNLINPLNVVQVEGLVLNSKKLELKHPRVSFFGAEYSSEGMHPCPKKIQVITEMTPPIDKQLLASFIGMVTWETSCHICLITLSLSGQC